MMVVVQENLRVQALDFGEGLQERADREPVIARAIQHRMRQGDEGGLDPLDYVHEIGNQTLPARYRARS
ncbi:MAG: hypothetical protein JRF15_07615 [Deltaproteobacteria bacterium]|jgi:hypothetical protein|nr:hypothetical protein [Deltaproteobacteria bacterium]